MRTSNWIISLGRDEHEKKLETDTYPNFGKGKTSTERTSVLERDVDWFPGGYLKNWMFPAEYALRLLRLRCGEWKPRG